jgi:hypothetical protein
MKAATRMKSAAPRVREKPIEMRTLDDGTLEVRTTDADPYLAEARAADDVRLAQVLADFRRRGHARPVRLVLCHDGVQAARSHAAVRLPAAAVPLDLRSEGLTGFVLTAAEARAALRPLFGSRADGLFRLPSWPVSFWEVHVLSGRTQVYETRTWQDARGDR